MVGSYLLQMNLRSGRGAVGSVHGSTSAGAGRDQEGHDLENGRENVEESHDTPRLAPLSPPLLPLMTQAEMMAKLLASCRETARALELMAQAVGGLARGDPSGNSGNGGGAHGLERPCSYQDFLKTNPPTFAPTAEPLDVEH
jgi:hypothetical protein